MSKYDRNLCFSHKAVVPWKYVNTYFKELKEVFQRIAESIFGDVSTSMRKYRTGSLCRFTVTFKGMVGYSDEVVYKAIEGIIHILIAQIPPNLIEHAYWREIKRIGDEYSSHKYRHIRLE